MAVRHCMHKNHTHLVRGGTTGLLEKASIWEAELMQQATQDLAPLCAQLQNDATLRVMLNLLMPELSLQSQAIKLQYNAGGGGCFPMHFDTDAAVDTRRVTAIWYLNPGWQPGHGGELRLYPFPQPAVDIAPLNDRLVLFSSTDMLHRVLPSSRERCCFTIWLSEGLRRRAGASVAAEEQAAARAELQRALSRTQPLDGEEAWRLILHPHIRHHAAKLRHCAEWEQSVRESHPQGPQLQVALDTFTAEVAVVARALAPLLPALAAGLPPEHMPRRSWF
ncbi:hypothetical protein D9Q98_007352 [Chlorella vulgaris]|uniref:Fe2OG dioxygenase domain-containing protein n=1 Tax=Chlorella vulgaris TaxID=3077 RepID=A0A9D4TL29_CHLVU|nr:hypothetical protein D9Q98_007352 [Chlorella vulgaris]